MKRIAIERTKSGKPARWEYGGGSRNTGEVSIVADQNGQRKRAIYIRRSGHLANAKHALIPIECGDYIIQAYHHRQDFLIKIYKIQGFDTEFAKIQGFDTEFAITELVYEFSNNQWNEPLPTYLQAAVEASKQKATCYHCREPHYIAT